MAKKREADATEADTNLRFEDGVARLEAIVRGLESGDLPLEQALASFESGVALVRTLSARLNAAEAHVEVLTRNADGGLERVAHDDGDE